MTQIKAYSKAELAALYGVSVATLLNWLTANSILSDQELADYKRDRVLKTPLVNKIFQSKIGPPEI